MSSPSEAAHATGGTAVLRDFDLLEVLRTPYRIDIFQTVYFVLNDFDELYELAQRDLIPLIHEARRLGMHEPTFPLKEIA